MSVSLFADNSDNFFAQNDQQTTGNFDITLTRKNMAINTPKGSILVKAPSTKGLVLIRYYLGDMALDDINNIRQQAKCELTTP